MSASLAYAPVVAITTKRNNRLRIQDLLFSFISSNGRQICRTLIGYASKFFWGEHPNSREFFAALSPKIRARCKILFPQLMLLENRRAVSNPVQILVIRGPVIVQVIGRASRGDRTCI